MTALLSILALGFFLGMRHATDSDHVIAVSTIVSRERDVRHAAIIGMFWGVGHSITLLVVGGAIIVFGLVIPQRLGLSLEFCVALMLIVLGAFNLRITNIRTVTAITFIRIRMGTPRTLTGIPRNPCRLCVWIDDSVAQELIVHCARPSSAWYTVWRVPVRSRCWCCRSFATRCGH